jgi:small redox-active disulfide protein 2
MKNINIQVLGSGCPTCKTLYNKVLEITNQIDSSLKVEYVTDIAKIVELGAMSSPVFAINGKIITAGKTPDKQTIKDAILEELNL